MTSVLGRDSFLVNPAISARRIQVSAEQAGKGIQETYAAVVEKMKGVYQN